MIDIQDLQKNAQDIEKNEILFQLVYDFAYEKGYLDGFNQNETKTKSQSNKLKDR